MKKIIICLSISVSLFFMQSCKNKTAHKITGETTEPDVPAAVKKSFSTKYPGATNVEWEKEKQYNKTIYDVEFKLNGKDDKAEIDEAGNFIK